MSTQYLKTDRSFLMLMVRGICSFAILAILDMLQMQKDLNTILERVTERRANFLFFGRRSARLMNEELARRGIDYKLSIFFLSCNKSIIALNLLSDDYNKKG